MFQTTSKEEAVKRNDNRVLGRTGARELTPEELARLSGSGTLHTMYISVDPKTGTVDGDAFGH